MSRKPIVSLTVALLLLGACRSSPPLRGASDRATRPGWIPTPNRSHPDVLYVTGSCPDQGALAAARRCALADAARQLQQQVGAAGPVAIKGSFVDDEYSERRPAGAGEVVDFWVLVAFPRGELRRAEDRIANRVAFGLACAADPAEACDPAYGERVEAAMTGNGMAPAPQRLEASAVAALDRALAEATRQRAARLLLVQLQGRFLSETEGEFYAEARCSFRLIDAASGKVERSFESGAVKGGHIARVPAVRKALDNCVQKLTAHLAR